MDFENPAAPILLQEDVAVAEVSAVKVHRIEEPEASILFQEDIVLGEVSAAQELCNEEHWKSFELHFTQKSIPIKKHNERTTKFKNLARGRINVVVIIDCVVN